VRYDVWRDGELIPVLRYAHGQWLVLTCGHYRPVAREAYRKGDSVTCFDCVRTAGHPVGRGIRIHWLAWLRGSPSPMTEDEVLPGRIR
jgi:hypothetical protein